MRICFLSCFGDLMLRDTGASVRIYSLAKNLCKHGHDVHVIVPGIRDTSGRINGIILHRLRGFIPIGLLASLARFLGILRFTSLFFYDLLFIMKVCYKIRDFDLVQLEQPWAGGVLVPLVTKVFNKPVVVDSHDVFQVLRSRQSSSLQRFVEIFFEKVAYRFADRVLVVSEKEKEALEYYGINILKVDVISNGIDSDDILPFLDFATSRKFSETKKNYKVIFVGNLEYHPNLEAVEEIGTHLEPLVRKKIRNVRFVIVGRTPPDLRKRFPNLLFVGVVKEVAEMLIDSDVAIAPLFNGSGTRLKILEYFSCGLPVVSTSIGVEGLDVEDGKNVIIENNMTKFADRITELIENKTFSSKLGKAATELVFQKYEWQTIVNQLNNVYAMLLYKRIDHYPIKHANNQLMYPELGSCEEK